MLVSKKPGQRYGLIQPKQKQTQAIVQPALSVFADEDEAPEQKSGVARDVAKQALKKRQDAKVAAQQAAALAEDPSVFDYDGVYESIQEKKVQPKQAEKLERQSRYIEGLLDKAKERQREQDIVYERRLAKEREAEDHLFGDKDRFVTAAYKRKLEEDQKWLAEEKLREEVEAREDVVKKGHMGDFYSNLMTNNVAFGTAGSRTRQTDPPAATTQIAANGSDDAVAEPSHAAVSSHSKHAAAQPSFPTEGVEQHARLSDPNPSAMQGQPDMTERQPAAEGTSLQHWADWRQSGNPREADALQGEGKPEADLPAAANDNAQPTREDKLALARKRYLSRKRRGPDS